MARSVISAAKGRPAGNMDMLPDGARDLLVGKRYKNEELNASIALVFNDKTSLQESKDPGTRGKACSKEDLPSVEGGLG